MGTPPRRRRPRRCPPARRALAHRRRCLVRPGREPGPRRRPDRDAPRRIGNRHHQRNADDAQQVSFDLEEVDEARARWFAETAVTRDNAHRAGAELRARGIDPEAPDDRVTADEWIEAHRAEQADADQHREITEDYELSDHPSNERATDADGVDDAAEQQPETEVPDIRELSTPQPDERSDAGSRARVPTLDETAEDVARAQVALQEIEQRHRHEQAAEADHADDLTAWDTDDRADGAGHDDAETDGEVDVLQR